MMRLYRVEAYAPRIPGTQNPWPLDMPLDLDRFVRTDRTRIKDWDPRAIVVYPTVAVPFDYAEVGSRSCPIFSRRMQSFFKTHFPQVIQFLPVRLMRDDGDAEIEGFALGKILASIDCIDRSHTHVADGLWSLTESSNYKVRGPVVCDGSKIGRRHFFRVFGASHYVVCTDRFKELLDSQSFIGMRLNEMCPVE
ncbi:MAG: hypothetical protein JSS02_31525 [Planctomycetes bacterium]|nr:hypothetical protein [Planctomycetota bacterium]